MNSKHSDIDRLRAQFSQQPRSLLKHVWASPADYMEDLYRRTERLSWLIGDLSAEDGDQRLVQTKGAGRVLLRALLTCSEIAWVGRNRDDFLRDDQRLPEPLDEIVSHAHDSISGLASDFEVSPGPGFICGFSGSGVAFFEHSVGLLRRWREIAAPETVETVGE